jgi:hypothetical protein
MFNNLPFIFQSNDAVTQKEFVRLHLLNRGYITRNYCLQNYISRLSDIVFKLRKTGMEIDSERMYQANGKAYDFIYRLRSTK